MLFVLLACAPDVSPDGVSDPLPVAAAPKAWTACPASPCRVMPLGDSITDGYNVPGGYRILLEDLAAADGHAIDFVGSLSNGPADLADQDHEGHSGWRIDEIQGIIRRRMTTYTPDVVLLHIGTNDVFQNYSIPGAPTRLSRLVTTIATLDPDTLVLVATIVPAGSAPYERRIQTYNTRVASVVDGLASSGYHVELVDLHSRLDGAADLADGVHPNATGYDKMAEGWYDALEPWL